MKRESANDPAVNGDVHSVELIAKINTEIERQGPVLPDRI